MNKLFLSIALCFSAGMYAQDNSQTPDTSKKSLDLRWSVGLSGSVVDDDGEPFGDLFNVSNSWNFLPFPTRVHAEAEFHPRWSAEAAFTYNKMKAGKDNNDQVLIYDQTFIAFDVNAKFHFIEIPKTKIFDPYALAGLGYTYRSALTQQTPTFNVGLGTHIWFIESFGLNLQTSAKVKLNTKSSSYMLHSVGLVYRFK